MRARGSRTQVASLAAAVVAGVLVGCDSAGAPAELLTDPREIVMAGVQSAAALHYVHIRAELEMGIDMGEFGGMQDLRSAADIDVDIATGSMIVRTKTMAMGGPDDVSEMIITGGRQFMRTPPGDRWLVFPGPERQGAGPTAEEIVGVIVASLNRGGVALERLDDAPCGQGTCYRVTAQVEPETAWQLLAPVLGGPGPAPPGVDIAPMTVTLLVDHASRSLLGLEGAVAVAGTRMKFRVALSNHEVPVIVVAPPPHLVDDFDLDGGFGGGQGGGHVISGGGTVVGPVPAESP